MIQAALSMLDTQVILSSKQLASLEQRLEAELSELTPGMGIHRAATARASLYVMPLLARYPEADLQKILTPSQIDAWKECLARYAKRPLLIKERSKK